MKPPPSVVLGTPSLHSSPVPSLQGVSFGALPLVTCWRKYAVIRERLDRGGVGHVHAAGEADRRVLIGDLIGCGELGGRVDGQQFDR